MQNALDHAAVEARRPSRVFLLQRFSRGAQILHFLLSTPKGKIENGIASVTRVLAGSAVPAPFFRIPGLARTEAIEKYLASRGIMIWSADVIPDDWKQISPDQVIERSLRDLNIRGERLSLQSSDFWLPWAFVSQDSVEDGEKLSG
jgi:hypothetical protein